MFIALASPENDAYAEVVRFAQKTYQEKLQAAISPVPDMFSYASHEDRVVGCLGLYSALPAQPALIERYIPCAFAKISGEKLVDRTLCAEIGTRAVAKVPGFGSGDISLALAASLIAHARLRGIRYIGFTSNRTASELVDRLGIGLIRLGEPDLATFDEGFRKSWKTFFRVRQFCFGMRVQSLEGCLTALARLQTRRIDSLAIRKLLS